MSTLVLDILKFVAIAIGAVSGLVGTITETRDKSTGTLTRGGWMIVGLIVASSVVAGIIQAIEAHRKRVADKADRTQRLQEFEALYALTHPLGDLRVQVNVSYPITTEIGGLDGTWLQRVRA